MNNYIKTTILALGAFQNSEMITKEKIDQILLLLLLFFFWENWAEKRGR